MTCKDYIEIAAALKRARIDPDDHASVQWGLVVGEIANVLKADNPRFDRQRFVAAATGKDGK